MKRFIAGEDRRQITLLPECLDDYVTADNPVRLVEVFVDEFDLTALAVPPTIRRRCSKSTSTATSTASRRAAASNARANATSS